MSLGIVIVLEAEVAGVEPRNVDGRILAVHRHALDGMAHEMDVPGLGEFVAFSHVEAEALAADMKFDAPTTGSQSGRWFESSKGLEVVRAIKEYIELDPDETIEIESPEAVVSGLSDLQRVLEAATAAGTRFRLTVDY